MVVLIGGAINSVIAGMDDEEAAANKTREELDSQGSLQS
jgi:hypothetical protein